MMVSLGRLWTVSAVVALAVAAPTRLLIPRCKSRVFLLGANNELKFSKQLFRLECLTNLLCSPSFPQRHIVHPILYLAPQARR